MKKFELIKKIGKSPTTLTEAKKFFSKREIDNLKVDYSIEFQGIGNGYNFAIKRVK